MLLAAFLGSSELVQTFIPYKTLFKITLSMIPVPTHLSEAAWNISASWRHPQSRSSEQFCEFFVQLGRISGNQNSFFYFQIVCGDAFGWYLETFWLFRVAGLAFFETTIVPSLRYAVCILAPSILPPSWTFWQYHE